MYTLLFVIRIISGEIFRNVDQNKTDLITPVTGLREKYGNFPKSGFFVIFLARWMKWTLFPQTNYQKSRLEQMFCRVAFQIKMRVIILKP